MNRLTKPTSKVKAVEVFLRSLEESDIDRTHQWHNDARLYETLGDSFHPVSRSSETEWLRRKSAFSSSEINLAICINPSGEHIGNIYLRDIDWVSRRCELHIFIGDSDNRGRGYGQAAIRSLLCRVFADLNLNRVFLRVLADNSAAIKMYEKCGFEMEGRFRSHAFKNGQYKDVLLMGLLAEKYKRSTT